MEKFLEKSLFLLSLGSLLFVATVSPQSAPQQLAAAEGGSSILDKDFQFTTDLTLAYCQLNFLDSLRFPFLILLGMWGPPFTHPPPMTNISHSGAQILPV